MIFPILFQPIPTMYDIPPTIYAILNSLVNYDVEKEEQTKIVDLASVGHKKIFNFNYPVSTNLNKDEFEIMILNHFLMRRIGYETVTAFQIALNVKLNEIMPYYNKLFDMLANWNIFEDGESIKRTQNTNGKTDTTSNGSATNTSDRRFSDTPQNFINDVKNGNYVTDYNFDTDINNSEATNNITDESNLQEEITRTPSDKMELFAKYLENKNSIYSMIFKDLDVLFFQVVA